MAIQCPYCEHTLALKDAKPGRYTTRCPKCTKRFSLTVSADPATPPVVAGIRSEREGSAETTAEAPGANPPPRVTAPTTVAQKSGPGQEATAEWTKTGGADVPATGVWSSSDTGPATVPADAPEATVADPANSAPQATGAWTEAAGPGPTKASGAQEGSEAQGFALASGVAARATNAGMPSTLGGYQILRVLGQGGMGAVYLAKQLSLDRNVALKVMRPEWSSKPTFVSRFTREAYAAAQLVHHNVVQIYDFGQDKGTNYFSMEYVRGQSLNDLLRAEKKLDPEVAVGYVLQAARGLKFAHDQSMIHRDIKPDNLMLNDQGVVKVADLGLVKTPAMAEAEEALESNAPVVASPGNKAISIEASGQITLANVAMGTPAFMAPEQARDAATVDLRADIYSLGCTLYQLVTGRPPFDGKTAVELITKHQTEPVPPPETIVKRVPKLLSEIILKMVAKRAEDRYQNLGEVIKALEEYLGISTTGPFTPKEEHANVLSECVDTFNASRTAKLRPLVLLGASAACALVVFASAMAGQNVLAAGFLGLGLMTAGAYFVIAGVTRKTHLFLKTRELVFGASPGDWALALAGAALIVTGVVALHLVWAWVAFGIVAVLIAFGIHIGIDKKVEAERNASLDRAEAMLKSMRLHGVEEETLRQFVSKYSGERWEAFYEEIFGYEAKIVARDRWGRGERGRLRPKHAGWRDPIVNWVDAKQKTRREEREKRLLQKIEEKNLEARGVNLMTARRQAKRAAEAMVTMAAELKEAAKTPAAVDIPRPSIGKALRDAAAKPEDFLVHREHGVGEDSEGWLSLIIGPRPRFLVGAALLVGFFLWMDQNKLLTKDKIQGYAASAQEIGKQVTETTTAVVKSKDVMGAATQAIKGVKIEQPKGTKPLALPFVPKKVLRLFNSHGPAVAGLILLITSFAGGVRISLFAIPGAAIALAGPASGIPLLSNPGASMGIGFVVGMLGFVFNRRR